MAKNDAKKNKQAEPEQTPDTQIQQQTAEPCEAAPVPEVEPETTEQAISEAEQLRQELAEEKDRYLRLAAEYDNFRKRTQKEKDTSYANGKADAISKLLPVYDNLERALNQPTEDAAYKKGVEMTMAELEKIFQGLGVTGFGAVGDSFDPNLHNAVMHTDDESLGENVIAQVFQKGFRMGESVIRFAMVQVAN